MTTTYKQYPWKFKIDFKNCMIEWYQTEKTLGTDNYFCYFTVSWMSKKARDAWRKDKLFNDGTWMKKIFGSGLVGLHKFWYDCPHAQLNLYFICIAWSTQWTTVPEDYWK